MCAGDAVFGDVSAVDAVAAADDLLDLAGGTGAVVDEGDLAGEERAGGWIGGEDLGAGTAGGDGKAEEEGSDRRLGVDQRCAPGLLLPIRYEWRGLSTCVWLTIRQRNSDMIVDISLEPLC